MIPYILLSLATVLQVVAVVLAIRLIRMARHRVVWTLAAAVVLLAAIRPAAMVHAWWSGSAPYRPDVAEEAVAMTTALLLVLGLAGLGPLVTSAKHSERMLREQNRFVQSVVESLTHPLHVVDARTRVIRMANEAARRQGIGEGQICQACASSRAADCIQRGDDCPIEVVRRTRRAAILQQPSAEEGPGSRLIEVHAFPVLDAAGEVEQVIQYSFDLTERRRAEEERSHLTTAVEHSAEAIVVSDAGGVIRYANPAFSQITGYPAAEVVGRRAFEISKIQQDEGLVEELNAARARGEVWRGRLLEQRQDGTPLKLEAVISPVRGAAGRITSYVAVMNDVTQQAELEEQLHQAQKMEALGTLASGLAHDVNNALTAIFGYNDLARSGLPARHPALSSLDMIDEAARQAAGVIKSLLTFSQKAVAEKTVLNLGWLIGESVSLLRPMLPAAIKLTTDVGTDGDLWVRGNGTQLQQVLVNLAVNAREAMPQGGQLRVSLRRGGRKNGKGAKGEAGGEPPTAVLVVEDTGSGMSEDTRARVFEPFFTTKPRGKATGLGLAITHGIIADHKGRIAVASVAGRGTQVTIEIPLCSPPQVVAVPGTRDGGEVGHGETVLVVSDDAFVRSIMVSHLRSSGYRVLQAEDGEAALVKASDPAADVRLVIWDVDQPERNGAAGLRMLRAAGMTLPAVVVTGNEDGEADRELAPPATLIRKPFRIAELAGAVSRMMARKAGAGEAVSREC